MVNEVWVIVGKEERLVAVFATEDAARQYRDRSIALAYNEKERKDLAWNLVVKSRKVIE